LPDIDPTALCAFDIFPDGTARKAPNLATTPAAGAAYRWLHFDLASSHLDTWAEAHEDGIIATLRGINMNEGDEAADMVSLRVWMTPTLVLTVRRQRNFLMNELQDQMATDDAPPTPARMIARVIELLLGRVEEATFDLEDVADKMETTVYEQDAMHVQGLAPLRRSVIKLRRHVGPLRDALDGLAQVQTPIIPPLLGLRFRDSANRAARALEELNEVRDRLTTLSDHLDIAQSVKLSRNGYRLSVAATIFLPLGLITGIFGVNLGGMPGMDWPYAFHAMLAGMVVFGLGLYAIMRWTKWF